MRDTPINNNDDLHRALIAWYAQPGDLFEVPVDDYIIDIVRGDLLIEIQTKNFNALKLKLNNLTKKHHVRLVYPIPFEKQIIRLAEDGITQLSHRKSPKNGTFEQVFDELVSFPRLILKSGFSIELLLVREEEFRHYEGKRGWRRNGWVIDRRRLVQVVDQRLLETPDDLKALIPDTLKDPFTTLELAGAIKQSRRLAQRMVYCLRLMGCVKMVGKRGNAILYSNTDTPVPD